MDAYGREEIRKLPESVRETREYGWEETRKLIRPCGRRESTDETEEAGG